MIINTYTAPVAFDYVAMDTETRTYIDGKLYTDDQIRSMCGEMVTKKGKQVPRYPVSWWREHAEVRCWAYIVYSPDGLFIGETFEEWVEFCTRYRVKNAWWYNAPFDFAILDFAMLTRGFTHVTDGTRRRINTFSELSNDFGARYALEICAPYDSDKSFIPNATRKTWTWKSYDLRNILPGGLAKLLKAFDVRDENGVPIRKLEMDYQTATGTAEDIAYMRNDAAGLWWLIKQAGTVLLDLYGIDIIHGKPEALTASSIAKRVVLREMYPEHTYRIALRQFRKDHPMTLQLDTYFRECGLLGGGLVMVNPHFQGKILRNVRAWRYDYNSHYPKQMSDMESAYGHPYTFKTLKQAHEVFPSHALRIIEFSELHASLKDGYIPSWRHPQTGKLVEYFDVNFGDTPYCIFEEEYNELLHWYNIDKNPTVRRVWVYRTKKEPAIENTMRREYARKAEAKRAKEAAKETFSKLVMNGFGGKYSQNPNRETVHRVLGAAGYVQKVNDPPKADEKMLMHIVQGAYVTALGRIVLRRSCREMCRGRRVSDHILYTDTDSIHATVQAESTDPYELGALKQENEAPITECCFLAPKTYYEIAGDDIAIHAKGVNTDAIARLVKHGVPLSKIYRPGKRIQSLSALNVKGGKALLPLPKLLCKEGRKEDEMYH